MRVLIDTQCWLWMHVSPERFSEVNLSAFESSANEFYLSAASCWEIAIKYALGKLPLPLPPDRYVPSRIESSAVTVLPVSHTHALHVGLLPHYHRDPFDRLLIAQAQLERLEVLTTDRQFSKYDVSVRWAT